MNDRSNGRGGLQLRWWLLAIAVPLVLYIITQLDFVQQSEGWFIRGLIWDVGRKEIVADIVAPIWVASVLVFGAFNRRLIDRWAAEDPATSSSLVYRFLTSPAALRRSTWIATFLAGVIVVTSWTREWDRFGQQPPAFWYVLLILVTLAISLLPTIVFRHEIANRIESAIAGSRSVAAVDAYLFHAPPRWMPMLALAAVTGILGYVVLGQLDALLQGMHPTGEARVSINGLASVFEFDLSAKPDDIVERVGVWREYAEQLGPGFASAYAVATLYLTIDSFVLVPAYAVVIGLLLLQARRKPPEELDESATSSYSLLVAIALATLAVIVIADLVENFMTWTVIKRSWENPLDLAAWRVRVMWFASLFRTLGLLGLGAAGILILAFRSKRLGSILDGLVAVRGELLVVTFAGVSLMLAQTEDVIRRWRVSTTLITVFLATALAMALFWTASHTLSALRREKRHVDEGRPPSPVRVGVPIADEPISLRALVVGSVFVLAGAQVFLVAVIGVPAGLGFTIPAAMITLLWLFGVALPTAPFDRGDRVVVDWLRKLLPRLVGSVLFVVLGITVVSAAVPQIVYARHADWWLVFTLVPVVMGAYRLHTRTWMRMGGLEVATIGMIGLVAAWLIVAADNPELSPVALSFAGVMILYGAMPFYYSFEPESAPSRFVSRAVTRAQAQPIFTAGAVFAAAAAVLLVVFPLEVAPVFGTVAILLIGAMLFAVLAAAAVRFAEATRPPRILAAFRMRRTPMFLFTFAWLLLASLAATGESNNVTVLGEGGSSDALVDSVHPRSVFDRWSSRNMDETEGRAIPLVLVASSGGGLRASVWTSYVLDCIFSGRVDGGAQCVSATDAPGTGPISAMSGVSGGSLGLAAFSGSTQVLPNDSDWVKERLGDDYLAPAIGWLLLVDTPRSFIGFGPRVRDRADILEEAWERSWEGDGGDFLANGVWRVWHGMPDVPPMVYNGTSVEDPCRFNSSPFAATAHAPDDTCTSLSEFEGRTEAVPDTAVLAATKDLSNYLCGHHDLKLSTSVLLSARFPVVTPSGRVGGDLDECGQGPRAAYVVDGGYLEGSGAGTIMELWTAMEEDVERYNGAATDGSCIVPFLIQIDNGYENPSASKEGSRPREVLVPLQTLIGSQFGRIANAREQAAIVFDRPYDQGGSRMVVRDELGAEIESRYARITTRAHPGIQAPLGWTLSNASIDDLRNQLDIPENQMELAEVGRWLSGSLTCDREPSEGRDR